MQDDAHNFPLELLRVFGARPAILRQVNRTPAPGKASGPAWRSFSLHRGSGLSIVMNP